MASVSISQLILFIAAILVATSVAGLLTNTVNDISGAIEDQGLSTSEEIRSDISIINDPGATEVSDGNITLYVKNTGSSELSTQPGDIDVLINGIFVTELRSGDITLLNGAEVWGESEVARINVTAEAVDDPGENRAKVAVEGGEDVFVWEL